MTAQTETYIVTLAGQWKRERTYPGDVTDAFKSIRAWATNPNVGWTCHLTSRRTGSSDWGEYNYAGRFEFEGPIEATSEDDAIRRAKRLLAAAMRRRFCRLPELTYEYETETA